MCSLLLCLFPSSPGSGPLQWDECRRPSRPHASWPPGSAALPSGVSTRGPLKSHCAGKVPACGPPQSPCVLSCRLASARLECAKCSVLPALSCTPYPTRLRCCPPCLALACGQCRDLRVPLACPTATWPPPRASEAGCSLGCWRCRRLWQPSRFWNRRYADAPSFCLYSRSMKAEGE